MTNSTTVLQGRINRLLADSLEACTFHVGSISCAAFGQCAGVIVSRNGYAGHNVRVCSTIVIEDGKTRLIVSSCEVLD